MTTTNIHTCAECGQANPITDRFGHPVTVDFYTPPDGGDDLVMVSSNGGRGDNRCNVLLLTAEMAAALAVELASIAEADRRFKLETQS